MSTKKKKLVKIIRIAIAALGAAFIGLKILSEIKKGDSVYKKEPDQQNPMAGKKVIFVEDDNDKENADGVKGHLEAVAVSDKKTSFYDLYVKRIIDIVLSFGGLVLLSPIYAIIALAIIIDDPGPVLFTQKRIGKNKEYFKLHKFRSMKMSTPHDVPTHMLDNPDQYITRVGKFLRAHSLDELPQIWDIFVGNMSVIGPRPALWNQDVLVAERDKYGANDVRPGLTGWAQINGRDELEIPVKAKLDGEYVQKESFFFDMKCFFGTVGKVANDESVVEGGTGEMKKSGRNYTAGKSDKELIGNIGFGEPVAIDKEVHRRVLITGAGSYIGESFQKYAKEHYTENFEIDTVDMLDAAWREVDFSSYDIVYHVAGIAHADVGNVSDEVKEKYYQVNTDLAIEVAKKAKKEDVKEFIFMSSMIVYGDSAPYGKKKVIDENTVPTPANFYGDSKLQADVAVRELADDNFKVIVLRPPMIYGPGSKGNYQTLEKLAKVLPVFPDVDNERSMLYIGNLCEFLCQIMLIEVKQNATVLMPQNKEWVKTSEMVEEIAKANGHRIIRTKLLNLAVFVGSKIPGKIGGLVNKAFGNSTFNREISVYEKCFYQIIRMRDSIKETEQEKYFDENVSSKIKPKALIIASVASMIDQFNMQNIQLLLEHGYVVDVACNCKEGNTISDERIESMIKELDSKGVRVIHVPIPRKLVNIKGIINSILFLKKIMDGEQYCLMHCHSPIGSVIARVAAIKARKNGTKIIYTAHGFHFYKGAPIKNWVLFYPIEKYLSRMTDVLITINKEDYEFACKHMGAKQVKYIPGVGIDTKKFKLDNFDVSSKRKELGVSDDDIVIISVGELNQNKNHEIVIKALSKLNNQKIHFFIAGKGEKERYLYNLANHLKVNLHLLGYRTDVVELLNMADLYVFPSFREGLSVALMEAMAAGLPCIVSKIRGNVDLIKEGKGGYLCAPDNEFEFAKKINQLCLNRKLMFNMKIYNYHIIRKFDMKKILNMISIIYFA